MAAKIIFVCALALFSKAAFAQLCGGSYISGNSLVDNNIVIGGGSLGLGSGLALGNGIGLSNGLGLSSGLGLGLGSLSVSSPVVNGVSYGLPNLSIAPGSALTVTAISPIGPSGLAVASENAIQGNLLVSGQLPFLSAVAFEGALPTAGSGVASCGCGDGQVGITNVGFGYPGYGYI